MGQTAEKIAYRFNLTREQLDEFASQSHIKAAKAYEAQQMSEVVPIIDYKGRVYAQDDGIRPDSSVEKLAKLKPFFDKKYGMVTPGNSSQITDGACLLILASADAVKKYGLKVRGRIVDSQWSALDPSQMGLGPVHAATPILERQHLKVNDVDAWEINEAFAAQVLGCIAAWNDDEYCKAHLGLKKALGAPSLDRLNREGGAIALGHPIGASGARIVLHLLQSLEQREEQRGMASICIGGGQGGAMYIERVTEVKGND
jgi:acetyl-CoA C-acetyltransferase